ncbi:MAG: hypothetical protein ACFE9C_16635 [Candidatus Hodarchaeota archaeon]
MGLNSRAIERKVEHFLQNVFKQETPSNKKQLQRKKFILLSKIIADLFDKKNSQVCFSSISNLIILVLNVYNEKFPLDIYSPEKKDLTQESNSKCKHILKEEFLIE